MHSIRIQLFAFIAALLLILLLLLNTYPLITSRDAVFEEKKNAMSGQAAVVASSLASLDSLTKDNIGEVLELLDISGFKRTVVVDVNGRILYDDGNGTDGVSLDDLNTALTGKQIFRSNFGDSAFNSCVSMPISRQGTLLGAVYLNEYDTERGEIIGNIQFRIRLLSILIAFLAFLLVAVFTSLLLRRIHALINSMRVVASGDYGHRHSVTGRDEISELGDEFNLLTERLDDNERQRRRFVSDASHELKTPLASIRLLSDSIVQTEGMSFSTMREFVTDIGLEAERLQRTTEKLLDLSRLDDDILVIPEPVDVKQVSLDALVLLRPLANERNVHIRSDLDDGCVVMATTDDMFHIIFNLLENAVKYNVPDGHVLLKLTADETDVHISVEDSGIGIPEEDRLNIFSRFYRVDKARSREAGGSGLGLSIVHDAVLLHGGSIAVGANKPQGSVFLVSFPRPTPEETGI